MILHPAFHWIYVPAYIIQLYLTHRVGDSHDKDCKSFSLLAFFQIFHSHFLSISTEFAVITMHCVGLCTRITWTYVDSFIRKTVLPKYRDRYNTNRVCGKSSHAPHIPTKLSSKKLLGSEEATWKLRCLPTTNNSLCHLFGKPSSLVLFFLINKGVYIH